MRGDGEVPKPFTTLLEQPQFVRIIETKSLCWSIGFWKYTPIKTQKFCRSIRLDWRPALRLLFNILMHKMPWSCCKIGGSCMSSVPNHRSWFTSQTLRVLSLQTQRKLGSVGSTLLRFNSCGFPKPIMATLFSLKFAAPTPIQVRSVDLLGWVVKGKGIFGIAHKEEWSQVQVQMSPYNTLTLSCDYQSPNVHGINHTNPSKTNTKRTDTALRLIDIPEETTGRHFRRKMTSLSCHMWQEEAYCWPVAGAGRDVVGIAKTGSGKTLVRRPGQKLWTPSHLRRWRNQKSKNIRSVQTVIV